jgi:hypothetical protein
MGSQQSSGFVRQSALRTQTDRLNMKYDLDNAIQIYRSCSSDPSIHDCSGFLITQLNQFETKYKTLFDYSSWPTYDKDNHLANIARYHEILHLRDTVAQYKRLNAGDHNINYVLSKVE